eukprot:jgi/Mesvir1/1540/Mv14523-RA.1
MARIKRLAIRPHPGTGFMVHNMTDRLHKTFDEMAAERAKTDKPREERVYVCYQCDKVLPLNLFRKLERGELHEDCILCEHKLENHDRLNHVSARHCLKCRRVTPPWEFIPDADWKRDHCLKCFDFEFCEVKASRPVDECEDDPRYEMDLQWQVRLQDRNARREKIKKDARRLLKEIDDESAADGGHESDEDDEGDSEFGDEAQSKEEEVVEVPESEFLRGRPCSKRPAASAHDSNEPAVKKEKISSS